MAITESSKNHQSVNPPTLRARNTSLDRPIHQNETAIPNDHDDGLTNDKLNVLLAFGEPVTFTATVSQNSPPASPEPVTYAGWGPWEVNTGYPNPSSFQIISAGKDEAGSRTAHSGGNQLGMGDGSVRLADASDLFVFDGNSQPIGDQNSPPPVTHTGGHYA